MSLRRAGVLSALALAIVVLDQLTKTEIMSSMRLHESVTVIADFFSLTYIRNPGAAFGLLATSSTLFRLIFFTITSLFAVLRT